MVLEPSGPRRCHISRRGGCCNRPLLRPHIGGDDSRQCHVVRRVTVGCRRGGGGRVLSFSLVGAAADRPTPPFHSGPAHHAFLWLLLDVERPSSWPAELPLLGAESAPRLECVVLESSTVRAYCVAASLPSRRSARSRETADGLLRFPVSYDLPMYLSSPSADTSARRVRLVLLEDLFKQDKALAIFVELCFELS